MTCWRAVQASRYAILLALAGTAGCERDPLPPPATEPVTRQVIQLFARTQPDTLRPSAFDMLVMTEVRFGGDNFDFVFDMGPDSRFGLGTTGNTIAVLLPRGAFTQARASGLQRSLITFDSIRAAPVTGYFADQPIAIGTGDALLAASRLLTCMTNYQAPRYAKLYVESVDFSTLSATIIVVTDPNCGYRSLEPGLPTY